MKLGASVNFSIKIHLHPAIFCSCRKWLTKASQIVDSTFEVFKYAFINFIASQAAVICIDCIHCSRAMWLKVNVCLIVGAAIEKYRSLIGTFGGLSAFTTRTLNFSSKITLQRETNQIKNTIAIVFGNCLQNNNGNSYGLTLFFFFFQIELNMEWVHWPRYHRHHNNHE